MRVAGADARTIREASPSRNNPTVFSDASTRRDMGKMPNPRAFSSFRPIINAGHFVNELHDYATHI